MGLDEVSLRPDFDFVAQQLSEKVGPELFVFVTSPSQIFACE
jgi:hypothetical protein